MDAWVRRLGYRNDPFVGVLLPVTPLVVGLREAQDRIAHFLLRDDRFGTISGEHGTGKSTLLSWTKEHVAPTSHDEYLFAGAASRADIVWQLLAPRLSFFEHRFGGWRKRPLAEQEQLLFSRVAKQKLVLLIDDAGSLGEQERAFLETLLQKTPARIIVADTPDRVGIISPGIPDHLRVKLPPLSRDELTQLLKLRIGAVGGKGMSPFSDEDVHGFLLAAKHTPGKLLALAREKAIAYADAMPEERAFRIRIETGDAKKESDVKASDAKGADAPEPPSSPTATTPAAAVATPMVRVKVHADATNAAATNAAAASAAAASAPAASAASEKTAHHAVHDAVRTPDKRTQLNFREQTSAEQMEEVMTSEDGVDFAAIAQALGEPITTVMQHPAPPVERSDVATAVGGQGDQTSIVLPQDGVQGASGTKPKVASGTKQKTASSAKSKAAPSAKQKTASGAKNAASKRPSVSNPAGKRVESPTHGKGAKRPLLSKKIAKKSTGVSRSSPKSANMTIAKRKSVKKKSVKK
jgi:hypothetical protein